MRLFEKQKQTKAPMEIFNGMMKGISEIIELYDSQSAENSIDDKEIIYNYVMKNENGLVKIGISHDVEFRKRTLENAGGYFIPTVYKTVSKRKAFDIETMLHEYFSIDRKLGEWFEINYDEAVKKTIEFSKLNKLDSKTHIKQNRNCKLNLINFLNNLQGCTDDMADYLVISSVLRKDNVDSIKELIDIYVNKYVTEGGLETYNLFCLYLLLYLKEKYNIDKVLLKNGLTCSMCGYTVYLDDPKIDFCECMDWYLAVYEQTHEF